MRTSIRVPRDSHFAASQVLSLVIVGISLLFAPIASSVSGTEVPNNSHGSGPSPLSESVVYLPLLLKCPFTAPAVPRAPLPASGLQGDIRVGASDCLIGLPSGGTQFIITTLTVTTTQPSSAVFMWLLVYASSARYYPQCNDALMGDCSVTLFNGLWTIKTYLGRENCKERFHLVLVETNSAGDISLKETMRRWAEANNYPGLLPSELPAGIKELRTLEVETVGGICP